MMLEPIERENHIAAQSVLTEFDAVQQELRAWLDRRNASRPDVKWKLKQGDRPCLTTPTP